MQRFRQEKILRRIGEASETIVQTLGNKLTRKSLAVISGGKPAKRTRCGSRDKGSLLGNVEVDGAE